MDNSSVRHARLGNVDYPLVRCGLKAWLVLEDFYAKIIEAAEQGNREEFISSLYSYVSTAFSISKDELLNVPWYEVTKAFKEIYSINRPSLPFPILYNRSNKNKSEKYTWDYAGRDWYVWLHLISKTYGWDIEYIEQMDIDDGIALLQEILVDEQMQREWQWSMSEIAYPFNEQTKKSKFVPLERPDWMRITVPVEIKKVKIRASQLPVGLILKWDTDDTKFEKPQ